MKVLLAEDFAPFRVLINSLIKDVASLQLICEVADGSAAVEKARELRPDLILMDIGLPGLNGIEAARRIRVFLASSKILFVSQESSSEIVQEALSLGACGYILKSRVGSELLAAIESVLQGNQYVSDGLAGYNSADGDSSDPVR
jgi:DNA-binding NarL/FixJ family response regulator